MIWKLLRRNISVWQIAGYAVATLVGLVIVTLSVQFYRDLAPALDPAAMPAGRILISKRVSAVDALRGAPAFSRTDVADIAAQPWVRDVVPLVAADFNVRAGVRIGGRSMGTELFFEAVPARLVEVDSLKWTFDPARPAIPVVIPRDYLALYNFGFAATGGMPAMSESMLSSVPLDVTISGNGASATLPARIVGYSDWLNTIAVPDSFMEWASEHFGHGDRRDPSRLVIEVKDSGDPAVDGYLRANGYVPAGPDNDMARASHTLRVVTTLVVAVGAVITLLALGILVLSLYLLVRKNRRSIDGLIMLGYLPAQVAAPYIRLTAAVNGAVLLLSVTALLLLRPLWETPLAAVGLTVAAPWPAIAVTTAIITLVTALDILTIRRLIRPAR